MKECLGLNTLWYLHIKHVERLYNKRIQVCPPARLSARPPARPERSEPPRSTARSPARPERSEPPRSPARPPARPTPSEARPRDQEHLLASDVADALLFGFARAKTTRWIEGGPSMRIEARLRWQSVGAHQCWGGGATHTLNFQPR